MNASAPSFGPLWVESVETLFHADLPFGLALLDRNLRYQRINTTLAQFNGVTVEQSVGRTVSEVLPDAYPALGPMLRTVLDQGVALEKFRVQVDVPSCPGELSEWEASYLPVRGPAGVDGVLVVAVNITAEQRAEQARRDSDARIRKLLDSLFAFVGVLAPDGTLLEANRAPLEAAGISIEDVRGLPFWKAYWWSHDPALQDWLEASVKVVAGGGVVRQDVVVRTAGDGRLTIDFMLAPMFDDAGKVVYLIPSASDVSDRVLKEGALLASEARFRSAFETAPEGMTLVDGKGHMLLANRAMGLLFRCDPASLIDQSVNLLVPLSDRAQHEGLIAGFAQEPSTRIMGKRRNLLAQRLDGTTFPVEVGLNPIPGSNPPEILATVNDISERLAAQERIERALHEKTVLLHEVHHRVKNNLQIIASLLNLQARTVDGTVRAVLQESNNRVRAMALTHQLLYERNDFSGLELGPYLQRLSALLRETYLTPNVPIRLEVDVLETGLRIDLQQAIPCGLIVNELVTNALKHAFPAGREGHVTVTAKPELPHCVRVTVADDGIGLPPGTTLESQGSLGFQLMPLLADQLGAKLDLAEGPGTRVSWSFPLLEVMHEPYR
ncbi:MAG: hypothetical protein RL323_1812 [Pseudomonadota bacterium]